MEKEYCPYCMNPVQEGKACEVCGLKEGNYTPSPHHIPPGTVLKERYLIGRVLGEGGFGITYIGCDLQLELKVAVKEYFPTDRANRVAAAQLSVSNYAGAAGSRYESGKIRFLQEARTMAKMDKQQVIVSVRDFFELNNTAYIVMEYVEGITFKELVLKRGGHIPAGELLHTVEPLFYALEAMHRLGLIHRDISPENLMLENGEVRLLDFGCARDSGDGEATLTIALKHGYAPVEQYQNKGQGPWSDVYALCATIYFCLTGKKPPQSMDRLVEDELVLPRKLGVDLTQQQEKALLYGMGVRPKQRFQSVMELHAALYEGNAWENGGKGWHKDGAARNSSGYMPGAGTDTAAQNSSGYMPGAGTDTAAQNSSSYMHGAGTDTAAQNSSSYMSGTDIDTAAQNSSSYMSGTDIDTAAQNTSGYMSGAGTDSAAQEVPASTEPGAQTLSTDPAAAAESPKKTWLSTHRKAAVLGGGAAAVLLTATVTLLVWNPFASPADPANNPDPTGIPAGTSFPTGTPFPTTGAAKDDPNQKTPALPFSNAVVLNSGTQESFLALLENDEVPAIILANCYFQVPDVQEINKPVYLMTSSDIDFGQLTVGAKGYLLIGNDRSKRADVKGADNILRAEFLHVADGGSIHVAGDGELNASVLWLSDEGALQVEEESQLVNDQRLVFSEESLFADAVHVSTQQEYRKALEQKKPIVIDKNLTITEENLPAQGVPVLIPEGVEVKTAGDAWCIGDTFLVNRGTLTGKLRNEEWVGYAVINYGELDACLHLCGNGTFLNMGSMRMQGEADGIVLCNTGEILAADLSGAEDGRYGPELVDQQGGYLSFYGGMIYNYGKFAAKYSGSRWSECTADVLLTGWTFCTNHGEIQIGQNAHFVNRGQITNWGTIRYTKKGAGFSNHGVLQNTGAAAELDFMLNDISKSSNTGIITYDSQTTLKLTEDFQYGGGTMLPFSWNHSEGEGVRWVESAEQYQQAMADKNCHLLHIKGDILLPAETVITKGVAVEHSSRLRVEGDLTLSGKDAFLYSDAPLEFLGGTLSVDGGCVYLSGGLSSCGGIHVSGTEQTGKVCLSGNIELLEKGSIHLGEGGHLVLMSYLELQEEQVQIDNGAVLRLVSGIKIKDCQIEVLSGGNLLFDDCSFYMDEGSLISNHYIISACDNGRCERMFMGDVKNYGEFILSGGNTKIGGEFTNEGTLFLDGEVFVSGKFKNAKGAAVNQGDNGRLTATDGGTLIGLPRK